MNKLKDLLFSTVLILSMIGVYLVVDSFNDYMKYKQYNVTVTQLYSGNSTGKSSTLQFIAVYKTEDNVYFDDYVSASTYSRLSVGDKITLSLRPMDVKQTLWDNIIWFFIAKVLFISVLISASMMLIGIPFIKNIDMQKYF